MCRRIRSKRYHSGCIHKRSISGGVLNVYVCAERKCATDKCAVDFFICGFYCIKRIAADIAFKDDFVGNSVYGIAAARYNRVDADSVSLLKGFANCIYGRKTEVCRVKRVYAIPGRAACVGRNALVNVSFCNTTDSADIRSKIFAACGMHHKCDVNAVEITAMQKFRFAAEIADSTFGDELLAVFDFNKLLGRDCAELDFTA